MPHCIIDKGGLVADASLVVRPNTRHFIEYTMKPLAHRLTDAQDLYQPIIEYSKTPDGMANAESVAKGADAESKMAAMREAVTADLVAAVMPWVLVQISRECSHMPTGADPAEIRSQMMTAAWRTAARYDPSCPQSWPTLLQHRMRGAWLEAYRSVDFITRKHRALNNQWRFAVEEEVHRLKRELTQDEKIQIAKEIVPFGNSCSDDRHADWVKAVVHQTPPPPLGGNAIEWESIAGSIQSPVDPADTVCDREIAGRFSVWLNKLPPDTRKAVRQALATDRPISDKVRAKIGAYLPELADLIQTSQLADNDPPATRNTYTPTHA